MNTTTFETAKIGDRVWSTTKGWGEITDINDYYDHPLEVLWDSGESYTFTFEGYLHKGDGMQSLFWDEVKIKAPHKPLPRLEVDINQLKPEVN